MGGWEKHFPEPNVAGTADNLSCKRTDWDIKLPIEEQSSKPKRESPDLTFISLLIMMKFCNHYLIMKHRL